MRAAGSETRARAFAATRFCLGRFLQTRGARAPRSSTSERVQDGGCRQQRARRLCSAVCSARHECAHSRARCPPCRRRRRRRRRLRTACNIFSARSSRRCSGRQLANSRLPRPKGYELNNSVNTTKKRKASNRKLFVVLFSLVAFGERSISAIRRTRAHAQNPKLSASTRRRRALPLEIVAAHNKKTFISIVRIARSNILAAASKCVGARRAP